MRNGYDTNFLGTDFSIELPKPTLSLQEDVLELSRMDGDSIVIPYIHYSLVMSKSNRQALFSAANTDLNQRRTLGKEKGRNWFIDKRVGAKNQIGNDAYKHNPWDRGHLTRRTAVCWGDYATALTASNDSCAYTNACLQHAQFNEDEWRIPEEAVEGFKLAKDNKLTVMTGPIFTKCDRFYSTGLTMLPTRIPAGFWKTVSYVSSQSSKLVTSAYLLFQDTDTLIDREGRDRHELERFRITTTELQLWTGLVFDNKMFESNPLKFYVDEPESIPLSSFKEMDQESKALLAAGIADEETLQRARQHLSLSGLYELVDKLSWY
jgi:endonuclease G